MQEKPFVLLGIELTGVPLIAKKLTASGFVIPNDVFIANNKCIEAFGMSRENVDPLPEGSETLPLAKVAIRQLRNFLVKLNADHPKWALNDPAVSMLLPVYKNLFADLGIKPRYVICVRKPRSFEDVTASAGYPQIRSLGSWLFHTLMALRATGGEDVVVTTVDHFSKDADAVVEQIIAGAIAPRETEQVEDLSDLNGFPPLISKTYSICVSAANDHAAFQKGAFDQEIDELYEEFARLTRMIRPPLPPDAPMMFFWMQGAETKQADKMFSPSGTWQTVTVEIPAPPNTPLQVAPYHMPCEMWVRRAVWRVNGSETAATLTPGPNGRLETVEGIQRLTIFGPAALLLQTPPTPGALTFEMEFYMQASEGVLENMVQVLTEKLAELTSARP